jgi:hypothetical protein
MNNNKDIKGANKDPRAKHIGFLSPADVLSERGASPKGAPENRRNCTMRCL